MSLVLVEELTWVDEDYLETQLRRPLDQIVTIVGKDSKGRRWLRICLGWFFHADTGKEWATYWDYWINDLGEVILRLEGAESIEFPMTDEKRR